MTTTEQTNALATREFTEKQIRTRLYAAADTPGFGLFGASKEMLNLVYLLANHYDLDPSIDITLFRDKPHFTIDGRVRIMRRHPQYRGYRTRPLNKDEKEAWGYKPEEIVVECTIRTVDWGEIVARGKVSPNEFGHQPVAKSHPQEMAEKRAIARASRMAFGQEVPDEGDAANIAQLVIEERTNPEKVALNAAKHAEIFDHAYDNLPDERHEVQPTPDAESVEMVKAKTHPAWKAWVSATGQASANEVAFEEITLPIAAHALEAATQSLLDMIADRQQPAEQGAF